MYYYNHSECFNNDPDLLAKYNNNKLLLSRIITDKLSLSDQNTPFYKIFHAPNYEKWIFPYVALAKKIRENFDNILILGMGGATLNPQAIINLINVKNPKPKIYFINNTDPFAFNDIFDGLDLNKSFCIVISNSGETLETIFLSKACLEKFAKANVTNYHKHFLFIIGSGMNMLRELAIEKNIPIHNHAEGISGRYSGFTNISTLPGLIAGINIENFFSGAINVIEEFWKNRQESIVSTSAALLAASGKSIAVNMGYLQSFSVFLEWYSQIIAESLGKNGDGLTPIKGLGPNDQHSMLQLYLDGKNDKIFTMFYLAKIDMKDDTENEIEKINRICFDATIKAMLDKQLPVRTMMLSDLSEKSVGELVIHSMLEIVLLGLLMKINPFDQPGVESIKTNARIMLK